MGDNAFPDALPPQYRLHWYVLDRALGQGGFGITYLAHDTNLDQSVAIKEYLPVDVATRRPDATVRSRTDDQQERYRWGLERFIREARTLARFDHPNIVRVHSVFEFNDTAYMVMRFEEGETLAALLERRPALPEAELMRILLPILDGLDLVHNAGFIHRDIKPDNIHIRADGSPVLLDFGSARHALGRSRTLTILVAPGYAPFEQYYSNGESQGPWTDIYGLAATCYRAIAGRAPMDAIARSKGILGSTKEMLLPAAVIGKGRYSDRLLKAVDRALEFAEQDRPQTIAEWRSELVGKTSTAKRAPAQSAAMAVFRTSSPPRPEAASAATDDPMPPTVRTTRWSAVRGPMIWAAGGAIAIIAVLAVLPTLIAFWKGTGRATAPSAEPAPAAVTAPVAATDNADALRTRLTALEQELADDRKRLSEVLQRAESERKRQEDERTRAMETKASPAKPVASVRRQAPPRSELASVEARHAPAPAIERSPMQEAPAAAPAPPAPAPVPPSPAAPAPPAPAPVPPSPAELLANADRAYARGNHSEAVAILKSLSERNYAKALIKLGDLYLQGDGVERNDQEALRLFHRAAKQGDGDARMRLGDLYAKGRGVPQSHFQAYVWYSAAARAGNAAAKLNQERTAALLQPVEIQQAGKIVDTIVRSAKEK